MGKAGYYIDTQKMDLKSGWGFGWYMFGFFYYFSQIIFHNSRCCEL